MAIITKATIASILGIDASDINDAIYSWALREFYILTGLNVAETEYTFEKVVGRAENYVRLPRKNVSSVDKIEIDGEEQAFTLDTDLKINAASGLVYFSTGFSGKVYIEYTCGAYTATAEMDLLVALLVLKGLATFNPTLINQESTIKIGKYSKSIGAASKSMEDYLCSLNSEIVMIKSIIDGDDFGIEVGGIA